MTDPDFAGALANLSPAKRALLAAMLQPPPEPLAIIGLACRFPGGANTPEQFWQLLLAGRDAITEVPADRWPVNDYYDPDPSAPGKTLSRHGGFLDQVDQFDAAFFGIAPREAQRMDPQQRLFLEVAWEALEHAGQTLDGLAGSAAGVYAAVYQGDYASLQLSDASAIDAYVASGTSHAILANRLSHFLDLRGPSLAVDTACSSSLVALHLAAHGLRQNEIDLAIVGGVNLMLSPLTALSVARWGAIAPDGRIKAFDAAADGIVRGEGCGVLVLKRLSDARRAGDPILALYRGSAINQDGRTNVLTAPNGLAQQQVLAEALRRADLRPEQVGYIEAHGTGTPLGDPIEVEALLAVYGPGHRAAAHGRAPLWVGSVKTNLGHLEAAAGIAGLIKTVLILQHGLIPPHLHFHALNPHISLGDVALAFPLAPQPWPAPGDAPRRAAVSSFGFGGANAHVLLEEAPPPQAQAAPPALDAPVVLALSAPQADALPALARAYRAALDGWQAASVPPAAVAASAAARRTHFSHRLAVAGRSHADLAAALDAFLAQENHPGLAVGRRLAGAAAGPVFVFSGQGVQWEGMARELYPLYPAFRAALDECARAFAPRLDLSLTDVLLGAAPASLADTALAQPAIFAVQVALAAQWRAWGLHPAAVVGHSLGEVAAAYVAGALTLAEAAQVVVERSRLMQALTGKGRMAAVNLAPEALLPRLARYPDLALAAFNAPASSVVSGAPDALRACLAELEAAGARVQPLPVDYAFHSPQVRPLVAPLVRALADLRPQTGQLPLVSTVTGARLSGDQLDAAYWGRNLAEPVRFAPAIAGLIAEGFDVFLEVSPHPALSPYVRQALEAADRPGVVAHSLQRGRDEALTLAANLGRLYAHGLRPDWPALFGPQPVVALPAYPWQHRRYWFHPNPAPAASGGPALHPLLDRRVRSPLLSGAVFESVVTAQHPPYQGDHRIHAVLVIPAAAYIEMAAAAGRLLFGAGPYTLRNLVVRDALVVPSEGHITLQLALAAADPGRPVDFEIHAAASDAPDEWRVYARGQLAPAAPPDSAPFDPAAVQARCAEALDGPAYYQLGRDFGGALGPRFQSLQRLWRRAGEVVGQLAASPQLAPEAAGYGVHPAYLDAAFHIAYAAQSGGLSAPGILMPIAFDDVTVYRTAETSGWCHFELRGEAEHGPVVGDARLYNGDGALVVEARGVRYLRAAGSEALLRHVRAPSRAAVYQLSWQPQPLPAAAPSTPAAAGWLLLADASEPARALAQALRGRGFPVALALPGSAFSAAPDGAFAYVPSEPDHYRHLLMSEWARGLSGPLHILDLRRAAVNEAEPAPPPNDALLPQLHLVQAALSVAGGPPPRLWFVTRHAQPVGPEPLALAGSLIWGFGRTLALEHPDLFGGLIDLGADPPEAAAADLAAQLLAPDDENQTAWRGGQRFVPRLLKAPADADPPSSVPPTRADAAYLVTGATGGIGRALARWLVERGARHLLLLSRSGGGPDLEPEWAALREQGARVSVAAVDVADAGALASALATPGLPPLAGVFHAAGVVADAALLALTAAQLSAVMAAKVRGAWNLHALTAGLPLEHFVLFSSAAAVLGSPGQANYAAANAYLDALAHARRAQGLPALSLNWGPWQTGMSLAVGDKGRRRWEAWGLEPLTAEHGLERLARLLGHAAPQLAVLNLRWPPPTPQALAHVQRAPLFRELVRGLPSAPPPAAPPLRLELAGLPPRRQKQVLVDYLGRQVAALLGWEADHAIDPQQGFFDLGLDSLTAVELKERLDSALPLPQPLPATAAFDYPSIDRLAAYLLDQLAAPAAEAAPSAPQPAAPAPADGLDQLPEDELAALLADELRQIENDKRQPHP